VTVSELIEKLKDMPQDKVVWAFVYGKGQPPSTVTQGAIESLPREFDAEGRLGYNAVILI